MGSSEINRSFNASSSVSVRDTTIRGGEGQSVCVWEREIAREREREREIASEREREIER